MNTRTKIHGRSKTLLHIRGIGSCGDVRKGTHGRQLWGVARQDAIVRIVVEDLQFLA